MTNTVPTLKPTNSRSRGAITREALIEAALEIFGRDGFEAASTRSIADKAGTNQALINYHFKGKHGLYLAVFEHISAQAMGGLGQTVKVIRTEIADIENLPAEAKKELAIVSLEKLSSGLIHMMNSDLTRHWSNLIMREQQHPTEAFDIMHNGFMGHLHKLSSRLIALAKHISADSEQAKLLSVLLFGQILVLKVSRATLLTTMQWEKFSEREMQISEKQIFANIRAILN